MKKIVLLTLVSFLMCSGCGLRLAEQKPQAPSTGHAQETWQYWEAFNRAAVSGVGAEVLQEEAYQQQVQPKEICDVLEDVVAGEQARCRTISDLPELNIDPDLIAYANHYVKARIQLASVLTDYAMLVKKQEEITSLPVIGTGLLLNLLNHSEDKKDGILWSAVGDQARQTSSDLQKLKDPIEAVETKILAVREALMQLTPEEMTVRAKLAQDFNREFPPKDSYAKEASLSLTPANLNKEQIIQSLLGKQIDGWTFASPQEFVSFDITATSNLSDLLTDYDVQTHVKGASGDERNLKLRITYGKFYTRFKLVSLKVLP